MPYLSFSGTGEMKIPLAKLGGSYLGSGIRFLYDKAGDGEMSLAELAISGAWVQRFTATSYLSVGFELAGYQRAFSLEQLQFGNQYNGDVFDPSLSPREFALDQQKMYADFASGVQWHFEHEEKRHVFDVGLGIYHLNRPEVNFSQQKPVELFMRWSIYGLFEFEMNERTDIAIVVNQQIQGVYSETLSGVKLRYYLKPPGWKRIAFELGSYYRFGDAIIPVAGFLKGPWSVGFSYDITLSDLQAINRRRGGPELSVVYSITKVKPLTIQKSCPVF